MNSQQLKLIQLLAKANTLSEEQLGNALEISRNAVCKHLQKLRQLGLEIEVVVGHGYRLQTPLELFDDKLILAALKQKSLQLPGRLIIKHATESSNDDLKQLPPEQQHGSVVIAEYQSAGRGRRGRNWVSPFGRNIYLSMGWEFQHGVNQLAGLSLLAGLCVVEALASFGITDTCLKWPNDILRGQYPHLAKLGGCLVEISGDVAGPCQAIIGIGLNLQLPADIEIDQSWADLHDRGDISRNTLTAEIIARLLQALPVFSSQGFTPFVEAWNQQHAYAGKSVHLYGPDISTFGVAMGIDKQGALLLQDEGGIKTIHSGEISLRKQ